MKKERALEIVLGCIPETTATLCCNGHISRQVYATGDKPGRFYMIGSMGMAPSIGLGICVAKPGQHVAVIDGDGNVLMNMGALASVASQQPKHFTHFCFDNGRHASTGGQRTITDKIDLAAIAGAAGYGWAKRCEDESQLEALAKEALATEGPSFLLVKVDPGGLAEGTARVDITPEDMARRLKQFIAS
ncbi:MAG: hypothetical protein KDH09_12120 [Chrysiogenetes bacterium]|nr:hypothetical protein [Chrysiogenetes bacterium]